VCPFSPLSREAPALFSVAGLVPFFFFQIRPCVQRCTSARKGSAWRVQFLQRLDEPAKISVGDLPSMGRQRLRHQVKNVLLISLWVMEGPSELTQKRQLLFILPPYRYLLLDLARQGRSNSCCGQCGLGYSHQRTVQLRSGDRRHHYASCGLEVCKKSEAQGYGRVHRIVDSAHEVRCPLSPALVLSR
jgi:hypothetical protein